MSHGIYLILSVALFAAAPATVEPYNGVDLSSVLNNTLCPTKIEYDEDANRIPRVIKTLVCKGSPAVMCETGKPSAQCCQLQPPPNHRLKCVQVTEMALVSGKDSSATYSIPVHVGCMCVAHDTTLAQEIKG